MANGKYKGEPLYVRQKRVAHAKYEKIVRVPELMFHLGLYDEEDKRNVDKHLKRISEQIYRGEGLWAKALILGKGSNSY